MKNTRTKRTSTIATQTDPVKANFCPKVILPRISLLELQGKQNSMKSQALVKRVIKEHGNSTSVSASELKLDTPVTRRRRSRFKRVRFKPGPLS